MAIRLVCVNDDAKVAIANLTAEHMIAAIDHLDLFVGSTVVQCIDSDHLLDAFQLQDPDAYARYRYALQGGNGGASFGIPAAGGFITVHIPVNRNCFTLSDIFPAGLNQPLISASFI